MHISAAPADPREAQAHPFYPEVSAQSVCMRSSMNTRPEIFSDGELCGSKVIPNDGVIVFLCRLYLERCVLLE